MPVTSLDDVLAIERVPLADRRIPACTYDMLKAGAAIDPDAPALSFFAQVALHKTPTVWSHRELFRRITQAGNMFRRLGVGRRDVVAFILPNLPETHLTIWGAEAAGIAFAINPLLEETQIAALLKAAEPRWLVTLAPTPGADLWQKATAAASTIAGLRGILAVDLSPYVPGLPAFTPDRQSPAERTASALPVFDFRAELETEPGDALTFELPTGDAIASYFCTGGTTGAPKIATRSHFSETFDAWAMSAVNEGRFAPGKTIFCGLPLFHVNGQLVTGLAPWSVGAHVVIGTLQGYRGHRVLADFWTLVEHFKVNAFSGVPTIYSALLQIPVAGHDIGSLEVGFCGAAPMPVELFKRFQETVGVRILEGYGLTEGACASSGNPMAAPPRIGSIGLRYPYQDMRVLILDDKNSYVRDAAVDEVGVIAIQGPNVFAGYLDPAHNKGIWIDRAGSTWLNTGDLGRQDADGYFWLTGRKKELIIRGGHNIDPKAIEEALHQHPSVAMAAAVGRPDAHVGELPVAYVQLKTGAQASDGELLDFAKQRIAERAAWPKSVRIVDRLPTTAVGKIFKPDLYRREIEDVVRAEAAAAGTVLTTLEVVQDPKRGVLARIAGSPDIAELRAALARYAFAVEVVR